MKKQTLSNKLKPRSGFRANSYASLGFTIVELLVVIVVIGILAAITIVSYTGITQRANASTLQSDLAGAKKQLALYEVSHGTYPTGVDGNNCPTGPVAPSPDTSYCLKAGLIYTPISSTNSPYYSVSATKSGITYGINDASSPVAVAPPTNCPTGFIKVPGSPTYGTAGFCVMKYEASQVGATTTPISTAGTLPWVNISQTTAIANSPNVAGCTSCHLITEAEWLTIAQNVLSVASNWSGNAVGSGYIYSGHNDNAPANALAADASDSNGYAGETNIGGNQRRTLTLTNGEVIWDLAGNVWEWTSGTTQSPTIQPGITGSGYGWREWTSVTNHGTLAVNPAASVTGLPGSSSWNSANGIGQIYSSSIEPGLRGFRRGGHWDTGGPAAGVLALDLNASPSNAGGSFGFRVSR